MTISAPPARLPFRVKAIYSWSGAEEDDLGFIEGDYIEVDGLGDGNWWHGKLKRNNLTGVFPCNYVEIIKAPTPGLAANGCTTPSRSSSPSISVRNRDASTAEHIDPPYGKRSSYVSLESPTMSASHDRARDTYNQDNEDEMQFSFQSSVQYYNHPHDARSPKAKKSQASGKYGYRDPSTLPRLNTSQQPISHSHSVPVHLAQQHNDYYSQNSAMSHISANYSPTSASSKPAPPPPTHTVPLKSHSSQNLYVENYSDVYAPESPYNKRNPLLRQATRNNMRASTSTDFVPPYDPETLNQSRSSAGENNSHSHSQTSNVFSYSNGSYFTNSQSSNESYFAMSDFSATSAGSFARHKYEQTKVLKKESPENLNSSGSASHLLVQDKKLKKPAGLFKKIFTPKEIPPLPNVENLCIGMEDVGFKDREMNSWIELKVDLNRANSLSSKERQLREKRVRENEGYIIFEPHKQLSAINSNEIMESADHSKIDLHSINLKHVDGFVKVMKDFSRALSPQSCIANELGMKYSSKLEYYRALYVICTEHFQMVDDYSDENRIPNVERIFKERKADTYGIALVFSLLAECMGLKAEVVIGSLKTPLSIEKHYWNSIMINGEWRFIDCALGNLTNPIHQYIETEMSSHDNESFYFLTSPLTLIYTHIPDNSEDQHIVPPIDQMIALALPSCFPSFFKNGLKLHKFNNALTRLKDYEIFELDLKIPKDIEVNAMIKTRSMLTPTLSQIYWKHNERYCKVKGLLPPNEHTGFLNIYSGQKGIQKSIQNIHPLSMVIPITHEGSYRPLEFVTRYPTTPAQSHDLYIKQPQNKNLSLGGDYIFQIYQHPSNGLTVGSNGKCKIALQSPSGSLTKFAKKDQTVPFGLWELSTRCNEQGVWRGLVSIDNGSSLCVFSEWNCK